MRALVLALCLVAIASPNAVSAGTTGSVAGTVIDAIGGAPIANASITASSPAQTIQTNSDTRGDFSFVSLLPGVYTVTIQSRGFYPQSYAGLAILADRSLHLSSRMTPTLVTIVHHVDRTSWSPIRPGTTSDVYSYNVTMVDLGPPSIGAAFALRLTAGVTFGFGAPVMH